MIYLAGTVIAFFLSLLLFSKKADSQANRILACWLLLTGIHLLLYSLLVNRQYAQFPLLLGIELPLPLIHGPFLFLYVSALTRPDPLRKTALLHVLPFGVAVLSLVPFFMLPPQEKITVYQNEGAGYQVLLISLYAGILVSGITYALLSLYQLYRHQQNIREWFAFTDNINLAWLQYLVGGSLVIWLLVIFGDDPSTFAALAVYVLFIGYFGIKQVGIFTNPRLSPAAVPTPEASMEIPSALSEPPETSVSESFPEKLKYEKNALPAAQLQELHEQLKQLMQTQQPYSNPELTLAQLAQQLEVHPNTLSQVINTCEQKNFFDYINGHRVAAFQQLVQAPGSQQFTLLSLAYECGFNSKTSFNRNFKKVTGLSPTDYLKEQQINLS